MRLYSNVNACENTPPYDLKMKNAPVQGRFRGGWRPSRRAGPFAGFSNLFKACCFMVGAAAAAGMASPVSLQKQEQIQGPENAPIARFDWIGCYHRRSEISGDARTKPRAKRRLRSHASIELSHPFCLPFIRTKKRPNKQARSWPRGNYCADRKAGPGGQSQTCCVAERPRPCFLRP